MTTTTDTTPSVESGAPPRETRRPWVRRGDLAWLAVIGAGVAVTALAGALIAGGDDPDVPTRRFDPRAEVYEREAHLEGQARTYGGGIAPAPSLSSGSAAAEALEAERTERQAHLEGQARTYGHDSAGTPAAPDTEGDAPAPDFVPGSRHMPTR